MGMMKVTAAKTENIGCGTQERISFEINEDISHLILDDVIYLERGTDGFWSDIFIANNRYTDIRKEKLESSGITII